MNKISKFIRVMKISCLLFFITACMVFANSSYAQTAKVSFNKSDVAVKDVLRSIEDQTEFSFFYNNKLIDVERKVSVEAEGENIFVVLDEVFAGSDVNYKIYDRDIILSYLNSEGNAFFQQQMTITGKVTDEAGEPIPGVTVSIVGANLGALTGLDGTYTINIPGSSVVLRFSFIGYVAQEITVNNQREINVTLAEESQVLDEVVVIGYGVQRKSSVTGSISQIKAEDIQNRTATSAAGALQGKTSGIQVITTSGAPGSNPAIRIRGYSSNSSTEPLYVVDGIILEDISGIDPNDIESTEILKDAASAAIYGAQAGNGVVLITTKKGKRGGQISLDYQRTSQNLAKVPRVMNANEYITYMLETGYIPQTQFDTFYDGTTDTDWVKESFEQGIMSRYNLGFNGANNDGSYYLSLSYTNDDGIVKGNKDFYKRLTLMANADYKIKSWLKVGTNNQIERYNRRTVSEGTEYGGFLSSVLTLDPLTPVNVTPGDITATMQNILDNGNILLKDENGNYYGISDFFSAENVNPFIIRDRSIPLSEGFNLTGSVFTDLTPIDGLTITSRFGYRLSSVFKNTYNQSYYANANVYNQFTDLESTSSGTIYYQWDNYINYLKNINGHELSGMFGHSFVESTYGFVKGTIEGEGGSALLKDDPDLFGYLHYKASSATQTTDGDKSVNANESYFGRLGYNYKDKYIAQVQLRADAFDFSKLPITNRWGYFPSVSLAWVASKENFLSGVSAISYLKIRASWGQNGSIAALHNYPYSTDMESGSPYSWDLVQSTGTANWVTSKYPSTLGNDELSWETSTQTNLGFDARFLQDRLSFSADYFNKQTDGLLVSDITPSYIIGGTASPLNAGSVLNSGFEFESGWRDKIGNFSYSINANLSTLHNEVTYLHPALSYIAGASLHLDNITIFEEGAEVWHFWGYEYLGVDEATGVAMIKDQLTVDTNDDGINDAGDGIITQDDKVNIGSAIPDFTYGVTVNLAYKGFDFLMFGSGSKGNEIFMGLTKIDRMQGNRIYENFYEGRWIDGADNSNATVPAASSDLTYYMYSDAFVKDGSYFKIKQIQLGYTIPERITKKAMVSNLRLYISLDDFVTFTKYIGFDPEAASVSSDNEQTSASSMGVDKGSYPVSKKFVFGVNLKF